MGLGYKLGKTVFNNQFGGQLAMASTKLRLLGRQSFLRPATSFLFKTVLPRKVGSTSHQVYAQIFGFKFFTLARVGSHKRLVSCLLGWWLSGKDSARRAGDPGLIPGWGRSPGEGKGHPLQYSCLENPRDRGAWQATVHGVAIVRRN